MLYRIFIFGQLFVLSFNSFAEQPSFHNDLQEILGIKNKDSAGQFKVLDPHYDHDDIVVYKFLETQKSSYILFIKDKDENHYVVKQEKSKTLVKQFRALSETLCAHIAATLDIPSHRVRLLPVGVPFPGKFITKRIATLHTLVPGDTVRTLADRTYGKIDIKQATDESIPFDRQGFNERTIFFMSLHPQLPKIVALDTFIGNKDRNKANILYDQNDDSFYAIDMALMYDVSGNRKSVAQVACDQVTHMITQNKQFTQKEREALITYRSILQELIKEFPPKKLGELLDFLLAGSGLIKQDSFYDEKEIYALLNIYKRAIRQSYIEVKKLVYLLFILINN